MMISWIPSFLQSSAVCLSRSPRAPCRRPSWDGRYCTDWRCAAVAPEAWHSPLACCGIPPAVAAAASAMHHSTVQPTNCSSQRPLFVGVVQNLNLSLRSKKDAERRMSDYKVGLLCMKHGHLQLGGVIGRGKSQHCCTHLSK